MPIYHSQHITTLTIWKKSNDIAIIIDSHGSSTVIRKNSLLKIFHLTQNNENFLCEILLLVTSIIVHVLWPKYHGLVKQGLILHSLVKIL